MPQPSTSTSSRYSAWTVWGVAAIIIAHSLVFHLANPDPVNIITWDVYGYYSYLPAVVTYGDAHQYSFAEDHFEAYNLSQNLFQIATVNEDYRAPIYTIGMAILWLPGYLIASLIAWLVPAFANDGLSPPFQWAVIMTSWAFTGLGLFYLRKTLLKVVSDSVAAITLLILFLATNYYHYAVFEPGMSHTYLFSLYAILLFYTIKWHETPRSAYTAAIGVSIALLCLARPSEGISLLLPLLFGVVGWSTLTAKANLISQHWKQVLLLAVVGIGLVLIQVIYWKWSADVWFFNGYAEEHHFDWFSPHLWEGLFSYRKGWLLYTPVMVFAIMGLLKLLLNFFRPKHVAFAEWSAPVWVFFLINIYVVLSWHIWWYASSFGSRALVQSYAVLAIPLAALLAWSFKRKWSKVLVCGLALACLGLNQFQDWQYRNRILTFDNMTRSFYWNAWGSTTFDANAFFLIDNDEYLPNRGAYSEQMLLSFDALADTSAVLTKVELGGVTAIQQAPTRPYAAAQRYTITDNLDANRLASKWVEVAANVQMSSMRFDQYKNSKLVLSIARGKESLLWRGVNIQRYRAADEWFEVVYQMQLPDSLLPGDAFTFVSWNTSPDTIYIQQMEVSLLQAK